MPRARRKTPANRVAFYRDRARQESRTSSATPEQSQHNGFEGFGVVALVLVQVSYSDEIFDKVLWSIFERVRSGLQSRLLLTYAELFTSMAAAISKSNKIVFDFAAVDEAQDISVAHVVSSRLWETGDPTPYFLQAISVNASSSNPFQTDKSSLRANGAGLPPPCSIGGSTGVA
jgi:hypothetical protein